ncbi:hypothetical protein P8452_42650 [Trifolium repens]|nr:hypothetical protein P8452_42650 [Trifolium repens]
MVVIDMELTLADDNEIYLVGIIDVLIKVMGLEMKLDFVLIDDVPEEIPISFGRPTTKEKQFFLQKEQIVPRTDAAIVVIVAADVLVVVAAIVVVVGIAALVVAAAIVVVVGITALVVVVDAAESPQGAIPNLSSILRFTYLG